MSSIALKDYYEENNKYPINYRLLDLPTLDKDVNCVSKIHQDGTVYLTKCSIDGSYIMNENEEDGYYHYGRIYDYIDKYGNGYIQVDYLESTGTQYIDTGLKWNTSNQKIEGEVLFVNYANSGGLNISPWAKEENNYYGLSLKNSNSQPTARFLIGNVYTDFQNNYSLNTKYYYVIDKNTAYINNVKVATVNNFSNSSTTMYEFASHRDGVANIFQYKRLYYLKIYNNDTLMRYYIPVIDSNRRPCLYDRVSNQCYYNQGTGEFLYG